MFSLAFPLARGPVVGARTFVGGSTVVGCGRGGPRADKTAGNESRPFFCLFR
jgi:hypothetical protein